MSEQIERRAVKDCATSLQQLYNNLPIASSLCTLIASKTPTLAKIRNNVSLTDARALVSLAICEVCDFFNVGKNMTDRQIAVTADLILERYWYLHLEEIKYCFRRAMMRERIYDRLDGNIIMSWLEDYDKVRTETAMQASDQELLQAENEIAEPRQGTMSYAEFKDLLQERAKSIEADAELLAQLQEIEKAQTPQEIADKEGEFKRWRLLQMFKTK